MDFVIFGVGTGAALVLIGWLGRDLGPRLRYRARRPDDEVLGVEELVARVSWARFCGSGGAALALCGALLLLVTIATLVLRLTDETGAATMLVTFGVVVVAMAVWSWAYVRRFGVYGVLAPRRSRTEAAPEAQPRSAPVVGRAGSATSAMPQPVVAAENQVAAEPTEEPEVAPEPVVVEGSEDSAEQVVPGEAASAAPPGEIGAESDAPPDPPEISAIETETVGEPASQAEEAGRTDEPIAEPAQSEATEVSTPADPDAESPAASDTATESATDEQSPDEHAAEESALERTADEVSSAPNAVRRRRAAPRGGSYLARFQSSGSAGRIPRAVDTAPESET